MRPPISYCARRALALRQFVSLAAASASFCALSLASLVASCWRLRNACSCSAAVFGLLFAASPFAAWPEASAGAACSLPRIEGGGGGLGRRGGGPGGAGMLAGAGARGVGGG